MSIIIPNDPRAVRTRQAIQNSFKDLLRTHSYQKISVTEITKGAGFARHTFYNHYESKEDLLNELIDSVLDNFIINFGLSDFSLVDRETELGLYTSFFQLWKDNAAVVEVLKKVDMDALLIDRLKRLFTNLYYDYITRAILGVTMNFAKYIINFNAYTLLGMLKLWLEDDMRYPPEVMAGLMIQLSSLSGKKKAVENYKSIFS